MINMLKPRQSPHSFSNPEVEEDAIPLAIKMAISSTATCHFS